MDNINCQVTIGYKEELITFTKEVPLMEAIQRSFIRGITQKRFDVIQKTTILNAGTVFMDNIYMFEQYCDGYRKAKWTESNE